jgi:hypothetical protein
LKVRVRKVQGLAVNIAARTATIDGQVLLKRILKEVETLPLELALLPEGIDREAVVSDVLRDHLSTKVSNHGAKGVAATLERMGARMDWGALEARIPPGLGYSSDPKTPAGLLDAWTERRHALVHRGRAILVTSPKAQALVSFVEAIAEYVDATAVRAIGSL